MKAFHLDVAVAILFGLLIGTFAFTVFADPHKALDRGYEPKYRVYVGPR